MHTFPFTIPGEESRFVLNFPARSTSNTVVPQASMPSMTAGTICWWMKNNLNNYNLFFYVAPAASNPALEIYFGIFWKFQLGLRSPKYVIITIHNSVAKYNHYCLRLNMKQYKNQT